MTRETGPGDRQLIIKYSAYGGALPPRPIQTAAVEGQGSALKMADGLERQSWLGFEAAATYGLELIYPYETECHVVNDKGTIRFEWDFLKEPEGRLTGGEFLAFSPRDASKYYLFNTRVDLQPPPGYVLRTQPHPRYYTDDKGTVPLAVVGHVQSEWYSRLLFIVFRTPGPGERHIFRKGEPFAQVLVIPQPLPVETIQMSPEEANQREVLS